MDYPTDLQDPDESRATKRVRLEAPLGVTEQTGEEVVDDDAWDDVYGDSAPAVGIPPSEIQPSATEIETGQSEPIPSTHLPPSAIESTEKEPRPTNGDDVSAVEPGTGTLPLASPTAVPEVKQSSPKRAEDSEMVDGIPAEAIEDGEPDLIAEESITAAPAVRSTNLDSTTEVEAPSEAAETAIESNAANLQATETAHRAEELEEEIGINDAPQAAAMAAETTGMDAAAPVKPADDPEFLAAAAAQKGQKDSEWQFDSSDADSSSDSSSDSSDSESDSSSEGGYEMLDPAEAARLLMAGDGDGDDDGDNKKGGDKKGGDRGPRTQNEVRDEIKKPEVVVTEDMKIVELGVVDRMVEGMMLIKASTSGDYQVLESGSVLCTPERVIVGAVLEPMGRVQEPLYSVAFNSEAEIQELGLEHGSKVCYVEAHSSFVFTQPLKGMKGTDASNLYDEEVGADEQEFSDDEAEAEHKRLKKQAKRGGRGGMNDRGDTRGGRGRGRGRGGFGDRGEDTWLHAPTGDAPQATAGYGGGMSYEDDGEGEDFYTPLRRPDNLSALMAGGGAPMEAPGGGNMGGAGPGAGFDRGRGRGRGGRGRGNDRGRGRGDRGGRGRGNDFRGGRGGGFQNSNGPQQGNFRGNAQSFPDTHNNDQRPPRQEHGLPPKPPLAPDPAVQQQPQQQPQQQYPQYPPPQQQPYQPPHQPSSYNFNGYTFQYGNTAQTLPPPPLPPQLAQNPQAQQAQQQAAAYAGYTTPQQQPPQQAYPPWAGAGYGQEQQGVYPGYGAQQGGYGQPQQQQGGIGQQQQMPGPQGQTPPDLAAMLRSLHHAGGGQGQGGVGRGR